MAQIITSRVSNFALKPAHEKNLDIKANFSEKAYWLFRKQDLWCVKALCVLLIIVAFALDLVFVWLLIIGRVFQFSWLMLKKGGRIIIVAIMNGFRKLSIAKEGRIIHLASRMALIVSFGITYFILKYDNVISPEGVDIYEFVASVIIIPIIFAEIVELRSRNRGQLEK